MPSTPQPQQPRRPANESPEFVAARQAMVREQLLTRDITLPGVLAAMQTVPRHLFVPTPLWPQAYSDQPLPIGRDQTISQPYIVALMCQLANVQPGAKVLEVGTGCGYQTAVLAELGCRVISLEIIEELAAAARARLQALGYVNIEIHHADGHAGFPAAAPYDAIIVSAAPADIPPPLVDQLRIGGSLIIPVGSTQQHLLKVDKLSSHHTQQRDITAVRFVPLTTELA